MNGIYQRERWRSPRDVRNVRGSQSGGGAAAPSFDSVPGLMMWLDANAAYATLDGSDRGSSWVSREGNAYAFAAAGTAMPLWEATGILGKPSFYFTTDDVMVCTGGLAELMDGSADYELIVVNDCDTPGAGAYGTLLSLGTAGGSTQTSHRVYDTAGNDRHYREAFTAVGSQSLLSPNYLRVIVDGGATVASSVNDVVSVAAEAKTATATFDRAQLGAARFSGSLNSFLKGRIAEILVYDHLLTAGEWTVVKAIIEAKYLGI